jgi:hypothetical protein
MARCKDPSLTFLNDKGFNVVKLPRAGIEPLDVLGKDHTTTERLGKIQRIWASELPIPQPDPPVPAAAINGQQTSNLKLNIGLKLLTDILGAMGANMPQIGFAFSRAKSLQFTFTDVESISVSPFALGDYLADGDLKTSNPFVSRYFEDDDTDAYVIFEVLKSASILVKATDSRSSDISLDLPAVQQQIGVDVKVSSDSNKSGAVNFQGKTALTFGFKAFAIEFIDGRWQVQSLGASADAAFDTRTITSDLQTSGNRISIK